MLDLVYVVIGVASRTCIVNLSLLSFPE